MGKACYNIQRQADHNSLIAKLSLGLIFREFWRRKFLAFSHWGSVRYNKDVLPPKHQDSRAISLSSVSAK